MSQCMWKGEDSLQELVLFRLPCGTVQNMFIHGGTTKMTTVGKRTHTASNQFTLLLDPNLGNAQVHETMKTTPSSFARTLHQPLICS